MSMLEEIPRAPDSGAETLLAELRDPATGSERLEEIRLIVDALKARKETESEPETDINLDRYTDAELANMLLSPSVPGDIKDRIANFVVERDHQTDSPPLRPEES